MMGNSNQNVNKYEDLKDEPFYIKKTNTDRKQSEQYEVIHKNNHINVLIFYLI